MKKIFWLVIFSQSFLWATFNPIINLEIEFPQNSKWGVLVPLQSQQTGDNARYGLSQSNYNALYKAMIAGFSGAGLCAPFKAAFQSLNVSNSIFSNFQKTTPYDQENRNLAQQIKTSVYSGQSGWTISFLGSQETCYSPDVLNNQIAQIQYMGYPYYKQDLSGTRTFFSASSDCQIFYYQAPLAIIQLSSFSMPMFQMVPFLGTAVDDVSIKSLLDLNGNNIEGAFIAPFNAGFPSDFLATTDGTWKSVATTDTLTSSAQQNLNGAAQANDVVYTNTLAIAQANKIVSFASMSSFVIADILNNFVNTLLGGSIALWEEGGAVSSVAQNQFVVYLDLTQVNDTMQKIPFGSNLTW